MKGKKHEITESKPAITKIESNTQVNKPPVNGTTNNSIEKAIKPDKDVSPYLVLKSGDTDLRRGAKELGKVVQKMGMDPHNGALYAFSNMKNSVKVLQKKNDGTVLHIIKTNGPIEGWPPYKPSGEAGYTVELSGKKKRQFLKNMGLPENI